MNEPPRIPCWHAVAGDDLAQGDLLASCLIPVVRDDFAPTDQPISISVHMGTLIVVTQTCDLVNLKTGLVALCPIHTVNEYEMLNPTLARKGAWEEVRKGRREGVLLLASPIEPTVSRSALVVSFREIYSLPIGYLRHHARAATSRWRLSSPYLEHFSQAFARFFMRVGLPSAIPPFKD